MQQKTAIIIAVVVVLVIVVLGFLWYRYWKKTTYQLTNFWYNSGPSTGGAMIVGTSTPLNPKMVGKKVSSTITSTNAGQPVAGAILAGFNPYKGTIAAIDPSGKQVTLTPVISGLEGAGLTAVGTLTVYGM